MIAGFGQLPATFACAALDLGSPGTNGARIAQSAVNYILASSYGGASYVCNVVSCNPLVAKSCALRGVNELS